MIQVQELTRRFAKLTAVDSISFEVEKGEVVGFLGPNGAGKTTTLRILAGYLPATSGAASVAGFDVLRQSMEVRKRIGYLPESVPLYHEHRVEEMMLFQSRLHGMSRKEAKERIPAVLDRVGILDRRRQLIGQLSRGLRQRCGLAVALLPKPEVLILDEPTSGLDPLQRLEVRGLIQELAAEHTVILSSHILPEVEAVCPRVLIIHRGTLAADGTPEELVRTLGGQAHVRIEAVVGPDPDEAVRLLKSLPGVREVVSHGRLGIHDQFDVYCDEDLREDVGALGMQKGWALRELSWQRPTLEQLFARIALDLSDGEELPQASPGAPAAAPVAIESAPGLEIQASSPAPAPATNMNVLSPFEKGPAKPAPSKEMYNLNPFDQGASRNLSKPKRTDDDGGGA